MVAISWRSKRLGAVSISSTEAEFRALLGTFQEAKWLKLLHSKVHREELKTILIYSDNEGVIKRSKNPVYHSRTKHIDVHYNFVKDLIENQEIDLQYLKTSEMIANCLTKPLDRVKNDKFRKEMGIVEIIPAQANLASTMSHRQKRSLSVATSFRPYKRHKNKRTIKHKYRVKLYYEDRMRNVFYRLRPVYK